MATKFGHPTTNLAITKFNVIAAIFTAPIVTVTNSAVNFDKPTATIKIVFTAPQIFTTFTAAEAIIIIHTVTIALRVTSELAKVITF